MAEARAHTNDESAAAPRDEVLVGPTVAMNEPSDSAAATDEVGKDAEAPRTKLTKVGQIHALLTAPGGASLAALCDATGWQSHSVRAALTGLRKAGHAIAKAKAEDGSTVYRIDANAEEPK